MSLSTGTLRRDDNRIAIQHQLGLPYIGKVFYVDPSNGSDTANSGLRPTDAYATVTNAEDDMTAYNHDVVVYLNSGTSATSEAATITWDKDYCHLVGNAAPTRVSPRNRIVWDTDSTDPCLTISGNGCIFKNIKLETLQASNDVLTSITGDRNYFEGVHFQGIGHATAGDDASARHIAMTGAEENLFKNCYIGQDTIQRSTTNTSLEFAAGCKRNTFEDCLFAIAADNVGATFVLASATSSLDRWTMFKNCEFYSFWTNNADKITAAFDLSAQTATGHVIMAGNNILIGADDWEGVASNRMFFPPHSDGTDAALIGLGENNA